MKKRLPFFRSNVLNLFLIGIVLLGGVKGNAQQSIGSLGVAVTQNFDAIGSTATAALPTGYGFGPDYASATFATISTLGTTGSGAVTSSSSGAAINWANGVAASSTDRAIGFLNSGGVTSPRSIVYAFTNNTGSTVTSIDVAFDYEKYRSGSRAFNWTFFHGNASNPATSETNGDQSFAADANNTVIFNPPTPTSKSFTISGLTIANGTTYYFRWTLTGVGGSSNGQGMGIDNLSFTFNGSVAGTPDLSVNGTASLSFGSQNVSTQSTSQSFNLSGANLTGFPSDITVTSPNANFEVSNDNTTWGSSTTIAYTSATLAATPVYVRFTPQSAGVQSGNITMSGGGDTTTPTVALSGSGALIAPVAALATNVAQTQFDANWNAVAGATGYSLDVSTSSTFGVPGVAFTESFTSAIFPPTGWLATSWTRSTTAADYITAPAGSTAGSNNGSLTTAAVSNPTSMTFYLGRTTNATAKTLTVEVSTTSQAAGFTTVATYDHSNVASGSYNQYTVDLSAYSSFPTVYIRFVKTSATTSPWRMDDIEVTHIVPSFVSGYNALPVTGTTQTVSGLTENTTYYYRVRATAGATTSANSGTQSVTTAVGTAIWDGSAWSNTTGPDFATAADLQGDYDSGDDGEFTALNLIISATGSLTIAGGTSVTVINAVDNQATAADFVIENNASLVQINDVDNSGPATVHRNSASIMRQDYTLWSSPVADQNLLAFSPLTLANRFYSYNPTDDQYNTVVPSTTAFADATGYLIRMPNNHPTTPTVWGGTFVGEPNNGDFSVTVANDTFNAVGNPYPSVIDADAFINENSITEPLYFWRKTNGAASTSYATYTLAGGAGTGPNPGDPLGLEPNGFIQTGQGFIVRSTSTAIVFNNEMRVYNYDDQFLRTNTAERHRIWLNLTNTDGLFSQTMIAYMEGASQGVDAAIDGRFFNDSQNALTSIVNEEEFAIQGRSLPFVTSDIVPLGFKTETAGSFAIGIDHVDGLFAEGQQIYLRDNLNGNVHDFNEGSYAFATEAGVFNTRFDIIYDSALAVGDPNTQMGIIAYKQNGQLYVNSGNATMESVKVYDISGRLLLEKSKIDASEITVVPSNTTQALLLRVTTTEGVTFIKKIMF